MFRRTSPWLLMLAILAGPTACGDPLADGTYRGSPLFSFEGQVHSFSGFEDKEYNIKLSVFWSPEGLAAPDVAGVEQTSATVSIALPSTFEVQLYQPPGPEHTVVGDGRFAIGRILLYDDLDGDGRYSAGDVIVGGADAKGLVYATTELSAGKNPLGLALSPGFHLLSTPLSCTTFDLEPNSESACGAELGEACDADDDCGSAGICVPENYTDFAHLLPGGYCVLPVVDRVDCAPTHGTQLEWFIDGHYRLMFFKRCLEDSACRTEEGYRCDPLHRACLPDTPVYLTLTPGYTPPPFCAP